MSEPRDYDTGTAEEDVDLEALLEQFREPEPSKRKRANPAWFVLAVIVSCLAFWMSTQATTGTLAFARSAPAKLKPTKAQDRSAIDGRQAGSVVEDYAERCRKGMTALEIRWIVEDFQGAGLDDGPRSLRAAMAAIGSQSPRWTPVPEEAAEKLARLADQLAGRSRSWYRHALADALKLNEGQLRELRKNLAQAHQEDWEKFEQSRAAAEADSHEIVRQAPYNDFVAASQWLADDRYAPWNLCKLDVGQLAITRHEQVVKQQLSVIGSQEGEDEVPPSWFELRPTAVVVTTTRGTEAPNIEREKRDAEAVFPLYPSQVAPGDGDLLAVAKRLHPAQLKMLLLLNPELAGELMEELERDGE